MRAIAAIWKALLDEAGVGQRFHVRIMQKPDMEALADTSFIQ